MMHEKEIKRIEKIANGYIDDVLREKVLACRFVALSCRRHLDDLAHGKERGLVFNREKAAHAIKFFSFLKLWKGKEYEGKEFALGPHLTFVVWVLMGWYRTDGKRRFRKAYIEMGRKGGKSSLGAGLAAYFFIADGEQGGEIYSAATKKEQAKIVWTHIKNLTKKSGFAKNITYFTHNLSIPATNSKCEPLSSDTKSLDGLDTSFASLDELHAHPTREVYDLICDSTGARSQPMILIITTAGFNQTGICYEIRDYLATILKNIKVKDGFNDDSFFGIIFTLDVKKDWPDLKEKKEDGEGEREDDWTDEDVWVKSVPGLLGITKSGKRYGIDKKGNPIPGYMTKLDDLQDDAREAIQMPSAQNNFLTKRLSVWTQQENRWIDLALWDRNNVRPIVEVNLLGKWCVGGIDLSAVSDLTVWVMLIPDGQDKDLIDILIRVWCPEARLFDTKNKYREHYQAWKKQGYLFTTQQNMIDYDWVRAKIVEDSLKFNISSISVDRLFQGYEFSQKLDMELGGSEDAPKVIACGIGYISMAGPCQEFERRLIGCKLNHGGNPILRWMADNVSISTDPAGNKKPNKTTSQGKIDGIIGILLGLDRILRREEPKQFVYQSGSISRIDTKESESEVIKKEEFRQEIKEETTEIPCKRCGKDTKGQEFCWNCGLKVNIEEDL
jgi:phage terminase large subunit-like protein